MSVEHAALLSPSPGDLPVLFEASRILARHAGLAEALGPLLGLLGDRLSLIRGLAVLSITAGDSPIVLAASDPGDQELVGHALSPDSPLVPLLAGEGVGTQEDFLAAPIVALGETRGLLAFLGEKVPIGPTDEGLDEGGVLGSTEGRDRARALLEGAALLVAEAWLLRHRLRAELFPDDGKEGTGIAPGSASGQAEAGRSPLVGLDESGSIHAGIPTLIGRSQAMAELAALISKVAPTDSTVLITGESGTGKELAARAIHALSQQAEGPFIAVNCAALPESLIESELFGHEKGAFTGAAARRLGRFELAAGGTIFLDEVAELRPDLQAKLLRVLQERTFERVGGGRAISAEVRVIAATNRDLEREVVESRFRADLYWRLAVFPVKMPPLRDRGGDVMLLADYFTEKQGIRAGKPVSRISTPAIELLTSYHWPGNVRELENAIERAVILATDGVIHAYNLPPSLQSAASTGTGPGSTLDAALARLERELIVEALKIESGNAAAAARRLGVSERRMGLALKRYGIDWRRYRGQATKK